MENRWAVPTPSSAREAAADGSRAKVNLGRHYYCQYCRHGRCSLFIRECCKSSGSFARGGKGNEGFTLIELLVATALLGLLAGSAIWALTQANNYASIARLYTGAETAAQNQIDLILTESPFNPQTNPAADPTSIDAWHERSADRDSL